MTEESTRSRRRLGTLQRRPGGEKGTGAERRGEERRGEEGGRGGGGDALSPDEKMRRIVLKLMILALQ